MAVISKFWKLFALTVLLTLCLILHFHQTNVYSRFDYHLKSRDMQKWNESSTNQNNIKNFNHGIPKIGISIRNQSGVLNQTTPSWQTNQNIIKNLNLTNKSGLSEIETHLVNEGSIKNQSELSDQIVISDRTFEIVSESLNKSDGSGRAEKSTSTRRRRREAPPGVVLKNMLTLFKREFKKLELYLKDFLRKSNNSNRSYKNPVLENGQYTQAVMGEGHFDKIENYTGIKTINFSLPYKKIAKSWPYKVYEPVTSYNGTDKNTMKMMAKQHFSYRHSLERPKTLTSNFLQTTSVRRERDSVLLTFLHIIQNGVVFAEGAVGHSDIHINQNGCKYKSYPNETHMSFLNDTHKLFMHDTQKSFLNDTHESFLSDIHTRSAERLPTHGEVFTISQFWGYGFFHSIIENIPRLALYVEFLRQHPTIHIHCMSNESFTSQFIRELGLPNKIITGPVRADIIYMPAGVSCGQAATFPSLILSLRLRELVESENAERKSIVVIKRSTRRWFDRHEDIWNMLLKHQLTYGYKLELFSDQAMPNFRETAKLFNRALMVIGPHGAGLSNIFFSQPGTIIIEGLCAKLNFCYRRLSQVLHHIYHGIIPENDCFDTSVETVEKAILPYFEWMNSTGAL